MLHDSGSFLILAQGVNDRMVERVWDVGNTHSMDVLGRKLLNFNKLSGAHINCETEVIVLFG